MFRQSIKPIERIIAFLTYVTVGLVGFVWLLIAAILGKHLTQFLNYHIMQSIFLSILYFIIIQLINMLYIIFSKLTILFIFVYPIPYLMNLSIIQIITTSIVIYLAITSLCGYYSYLPWVSDIINKNIGRK